MAREIHGLKRAILDMNLEAQKHMKFVKSLDNVCNNDYEEI